jgi:hypothetical protein
MSISPLNEPRLQLDALKLDDLGTGEAALQQASAPPAPVSEQTPICDQAPICDQTILSGDAWGAIPGGEPRVFGIDFAMASAAPEAQSMPSSVELDRIAALVVSHIV